MPCHFSTWWLGGTREIVTSVKGKEVQFQSKNKRKKEPNPPNTFYPQPSVVSTPQNSFSLIFNLTGSDGNIETVSKRQAQPTSVRPSYLRARLSVE